MDLTPDWPLAARLGAAFAVGLVAFPLAGVAARAIKRGVTRTAELGVVDTTLATFAAEATRIALLIGALVLVLTLAGVEPTSVAAVLGAATLAIGLALQQTLANVAAGVLILLFRPFQIGEFVEAAGRQGSVVKISLFSTELTTLQGLMLVLPNAQIFTQPITNYTRRPVRRVDVDVVLAWDVDAKAACEAAAAALAADPRVAKEPAPEAVVVKLTDKGPSISVRAWAASSDAARLGFDLAAVVHAALRDIDARGAGPG